MILFDSSSASGCCLLVD